MLCIAPVCSGRTASTSLKCSRAASASPTSGSEANNPARNEDRTSAGFIRPARRSSSYAEAYWSSSNSRAACRKEASPSATIRSYSSASTNRRPIR